MIRVHGMNLPTTWRFGVPWKWRGYFIAGRPGLRLRKCQRAKPEIIPKVAAILADPAWPPHAAAHRGRGELLLAKNKFDHLVGQAKRVNEIINAPKRFR